MTRLGMVFVALVFFALAAGFLSVAATAFAAAQERTVIYKHIGDALDANHSPSARVTWTRATRPLAREFTRVDETLVGTAMTSAWRAHAAALETGVIDILPDHFSGVALGRAASSAVAGHEQHTQMVVLSQAARPAFYHLDGSVLQVEAKALSVRFSVVKDKVQHFELSDDTVVTTLMNETTGWRVFAHEMRTSDPVKGNEPARQLDDHLVGLNYYPAATPWRRFWSEFDARIVATDFEAIADLGANAVRIFLPVKDFSDPDTKDRNVRCLVQLLRIADRHGLRVIPTLFDMKPGYSPATWAEDVAYLETVLPIVSGSDVVAYVDLKNEPDLDFETHGHALVEAWLKTMATVTRGIAPDLAITIGWSTSDAALLLADTVDVISYHDYQPIDGAEERLTELRRKSGGKPIHVTEIGASSFSAFAGFPGSPRAQANALETRLKALEDADGLFVWTLHDFPEPDKKAVGSSPWTLRLQSRFGLLDEGGGEKPAFRVVEAAFRNWRAVHSEIGSGKK